MIEYRGPLEDTWYAVGEPLGLSWVLLVHYQAQHSAEQCSEMLVQRQTFWLAGKALLTCWPASFGKADSAEGHCLHIIEMRHLQCGPCIVSANRNPLSSTYG